MASDSKNLPVTQTSQEQQTSSDDSALSTVNRKGLNLYPSRTSPLPGNRPIADNSTEDIDDMLGYLD